MVFHAMGTSVGGETLLLMATKFPDPPLEAHLNTFVFDTVTFLFHERTASVQNQASEN